MAPPDVRPGSDELPGYLSSEEAARYAGLPIGSRLLSMEEEANMLAAGLTPEQIEEMTPQELENLANIVLSQSTMFLGS